MTKFAQPARSVRDIKTLAGKADDLLTPHKVYMRLFALETERHRRQQERASAMARVDSIDARCAEIDVEKAALLDSLGVAALDAPALSRRRAGGRASGRGHDAGDDTRRRLSHETSPLPAPGFSSVTIRY